MTYDDVPAVLVLVWFPVDDLDARCLELGFGVFEGPGYGGMGADDSGF